jgi:transposase InsO family protein
MKSCASRERSDNGPEFVSRRIRNRVEARVVLEQWRSHYNQIRPHSSLDCRTPEEFRQHHSTLQPQRHFQVIE